MELEIPQTEYSERIHLLQTRLVETKLDGLLVFSTECEPADVRYLSDYWPSFETTGVLVPSQGEAALLIGPESLTFARARSKLSRIYRLADLRESSQPEYPDARLDNWESILKEHRIETLGLAGYAMLPVPIYRQLVGVLGEDRVLARDGLLRELRMSKSDNEIALCRQASKISEMGLKRVLERVRPGMTEIQVAAEAEYAMLTAGAESVAYPVWCCSGPNSNQAISRSTHREIRESEIVQICCGARLGGYASSIGRPFVIGPVPEEVRSLMEVGLEAEELTIETIRPGITGAQITETVHRRIRDRGYGHCILYGPAHGVGLMECEYPFIEASLELELKPNMLFNIDIFLADDKTGLRFEDGIRVTDTGVELLSSFRREVIRL